MYTLLSFDPLTRWSVTSDDYHIMGNPELLFLSYFLLCDTSRQTEGNGMMSHAPVWNAQYVTKVFKADRFLKIVSKLGQIVLILPLFLTAQCNATICGRGRCQETIENITCLCDPGFEGDRCQTGKERGLWK